MMFAGPAVTVNVAVPLVLWLLASVPVAVIVTVPVFTPVATPVALLIEAVPVSPSYPSSPSGISQSY